MRLSLASLQEERYVYTGEQESHSHIAYIMKLFSRPGCTNEKFLDTHSQAGCNVFCWVEV